MVKHKHTLQLYILDWLRQIRLLPKNNSIENYIPNRNWATKLLRI